MLSFFKRRAFVAFLKNTKRLLLFKILISSSNGFYRFLGFCLKILTYLLRCDDDLVKIIIHVSFHLTSGSLFYKCFIYSAI